VIYLLDTNAISDLIRNDQRMADWVSSLRDDDRLVTCTIVRGEIMFGIARLAQGRRRVELEQKAERLFAVVPCEPIAAFAGDVYATIKLTQQQRGLSLDENDLWIAATALSLGATLVSRDRDFHRLDRLITAVPGAN